MITLRNEGKALLQKEHTLVGRWCVWRTHWVPIPAALVLLNWFPDT